MAWNMSAVSVQTTCDARFRMSLDSVIKFIPFAFVDIWHLKSMSCAPDYWGVDLSAQKRMHLHIFKQNNQ